MDSLSARIKPQPAPSSEKINTCKAIAEALDDNLPSTLSGIVADYAYHGVDLQLLDKFLEFNPDGSVANPAVREAYKRVLSSTSVSAADKSKLFNTLRWAEIRSRESIEWLQRELKKISEEIFREGDRIELSDVDISHVTLTFSLRAANLRGAKFSDVEISSDMSYADLTGATFTGVGFRYAELMQTTLTGVTFSDDCNFLCTEVTGTTFTDAKLQQLVFKGTDREMSQYRPLRYMNSGVPESSNFLHGFLSDLADTGSQASAIRSCSIL